MADDTLAQASVIRFRSSCNVGGGIAYTPSLMYPHRKKSNGFRSESILVEIGAQRLKEVLHSINANLMRMFGSEVPIVLTSMQERGESLMGQDWGCRRGDPISPLPGDECVLL
ncbi:hypothetical protein AVEN_82275-1 [Araneus ventricosus]|uniref:Uncharacterized protein n=1 Tax=Araneus ventricosus TaxID=182803 RepID=A0A4Y2PY69_ARAVE|nr:hypothetical protein AVEN_94096-1 [Araneus ventricosus]GBN56230.1 hypothetical protein AVEN_82275-1 [Araneus ventricosus]